MKLLLALLLLGCLAGCEGIHSGSTSWDDPLQEALATEQSLETLRGHECQKSPEPVLAEIPLGTPVERARTVMKAHGFRCVENASGDSGRCLICTASKNTSWLTANVVTVKISYKGGQVTNIEATTFIDGP